MHIVHISDCYLPRLGGIEQQVAGLARAQAEQGIAVNVITATDDAWFAETVLQLQPAVGLSRLSAKMPFGLPLHPRAGHVIKRRLQELNPDVVHVHLGSISQFAWAGLRAAEDLQLPTVTTVHSIWGPFSRAVYGLGRIVLRWPNQTRITAVSRACAQLVQQTARAEVAVVGNGVDLQKWRPANSEVNIPVQFVCATRFAVRKRVPALIWLAYRLKRKVGSRQFNLTIAGSGALWRSMHWLISILGLQGEVRLVGRLEQAKLNELYASSDAFIQLSRLESFGIAAMEARAAGLPVFGRAGNGFSEFVVHGETGWLADSDAKLLRILENSIRNPQTLVTLKSNSFRDLPQNSWAETVREFASEYRAAIEDLR